MNAKSEKNASKDPRAQIRAIRQRFLVLNRDRLNLARQSLKKRQRIFVDALPLLFHINHPALPGFVAKDTPAGIADFSPTQQLINDCSSVFKDFYYERRAMHIYNVQAIYMIGSSGTIAYSEKSDFDIWVCHRKELDDKQVWQLHEKCESIRLWAEKLGLEVTFFVMDAEKFKAGQTEELSQESSGSAQFHLLLEEFYRTGLLLAGKYPAWWLVPPDPSINYKAYLKHLHNIRAIFDYEYIDFGELTRIPSGEFFGAAVWQLNKAVYSPYKSMLKLLLIESYAAEYPDMELLCTRFKTLVYKGNVNLSKLDPYVMMMHKVEEYLLGKNEVERCELARRCFYFKIDKRLTKVTARSMDRRVELMMSLVDEWGWDKDKLTHLDSRSNWKIDQVGKERATLVKELTISYGMVSEFAKTTASKSYIKQEDLNILGRRLYAEFERKVGKIELINPDVSSDLTEQRLCFVMQRNAERSYCLLYNKELEEAIEHKIPPIKRASTLLELVTWAYFNRILGRQTLVTLHSGMSIVDSSELQSVIESFRQHYPDAVVKKPTLEIMKKPARVTQACIYINLGEDPMADHTKRGVHLTSNRSDAFSYGGFWKNLMVSFDMLVISSWGEILTSHHDGENSVMECVTNLLSWSPLDQEFEAPQVAVHSFSSSRGNSISKRMEQFIEDLIRVFYSTSVGEYIRYIVNIGAEYYKLEAVKARIHYERYRSEADLLREFGTPRDHFTHVVFDRYTMRNHPLPTVMKQNEPNKIQMFYELVERDKLVNVWVLDERGSMFTQTLAYHSKESLLSQYSRFLSNAVLRCNAVEHANNLQSTISLELEYFQVQKSNNRRYVAKKLEGDFTQSMSNYFSLQVIGDLSGQPGAIYSLYCDGIEFSSLEHGEQVVHEVVRHVIAHRKNNERYPIYITDLAISREVLANEGVTNLQIIHYLNYKKMIEAKLNRALESL